MFLFGEDLTLFTPLSTLESRFKDLLSISKFYFSKWSAVSIAPYHVYLSYPDLLSSSLDTLTW